MELTFSKINYDQVGIINNNCGKVIENADTLSNATQKFVVGDKNGLFQIFGMKKLEKKILYSEQLKDNISQVILNGKPGEIFDRIFISIGNDVMGYSKKGKQFMKFTTTLNDAIDHMFVDDTDLFVASKYMYQHYQDLKEVESMIMSDRISSLISLPRYKLKRSVAVIGCRDRILKIVEKNAVIHEVTLPGPASILALYNNDGGIDGQEFVYGTADGKLGAIDLTQVGPRQLWELDPDIDKGSVSCISFYDITSDGQREMLVGRESGFVEVYRLVDDDYDDVAYPLVIYQNNFNITITSINGALFSNSSFPEIICTTYSGWIFGLSTEPSIKSIDNLGKVTVNPDLLGKIDKLRDDIDELNEQVDLKEKQINNSSVNNAGNVTSVPSLPVHSDISYYQKFELSPQEAAYILTIEGQVSIDFFLVQSDAPIDLLDTEKNSPVASHSHVNPQDGNCLLATFRCQANTTRINLKVRSIEGQYGVIRVYVTPRSAVIKTCQMLQFHVKPLSLHKRIQKIKDKRPVNTLMLKGSFSLAEAHSWLVFCLPETPEKIPNMGSSNSSQLPGGKMKKLFYESTFLGTQLKCKYTKGEINFESDNLSTISILKDVLSKEATKKGSSLDISFETNDASIDHLLHLIHPRIDTLLLLAKKVQLIDPLKELVNNEHVSPSEFLSADYCEILENVDQLKEEFKKQPCHLERLYGIITDLYIDKYKFKDSDVRNNVKELTDLLECYQLEKLIAFFNKDVNAS